MNDIKLGDLVVVVRVCCRDVDGIIGNIFAVDDISFDHGVCNACGGPLGPKGYWSRPANSRPTRAPLSWLRRIPPLSELSEAEYKQSEPA